MVIDIAPTNSIKRKVSINNYTLTDTYLRIDYNISMDYVGKLITIHGIPIYLYGADFDYYKHLEINEMLTKVVNDYL